jgi:hypothetical protein
MCWTLKREIAEWFALRTPNANAEPIVVTARIKKADLYFVKSSEFEAVVRPRRSRAIKVRRKKLGNWQPPMQWGEPGGGEQPKVTGS